MKIQKDKFSISSISEELIKKDKEVKEPSKEDKEVKQPSKEIKEPIKILKYIF